MDRNALTGMLLITALVMVWMLYLQPDDKKKSTETPPATTQPQNPSNSPKSDSLNPSKSNPTGQSFITNTPAKSLNTDSLQAQKLAEQYGEFSKVMTGTGKTIKVTTDKLNLLINTKGGFIQPVYLNDYKTHDSLPLPIVPTGKDNYYTFQFPTNAAPVNTRDLFFTVTEGPNQDFTVKSGEKKTIRLRAEISPTQYLEQSYTFTGGRYDLEYDFRIIGLQNQIVTANLFMEVSAHIPITEKSAEKMKPEVTLNYKEGDDIETLDIPTPEEPVSQKSIGSLDWFAYKSQFFTTAYLPKNKVTGEKFNHTAGDDKTTIGHMVSVIKVPYDGNPNFSTGFTIYYGPNDLSLLGSYDRDLDKVVKLGWGPLRYMTLGIVWLFKIMEESIGDYGVIIFLLAVIIKLLLLPLTYKSHLSTVKMQVVNRLPEVKALDEKYKDDPTKLQTAKMTFYRQVGVSPFGGCIPLLLQFPILITMFNFFPQSIELRQEALWWADDLSTYDSILDFGFSIPLYGDHVSLFTLLMTASTLLFSWLQQKMQGNSAGPAQMKYLIYIMPLLFLGILNNYSAGLSYYYLVFNVLSIGQMYLMQFAVDSEAIHQKILEKQKSSKGQPLKKSRLQRWVEEQQKKQAEMARQRSNPPARRKK